MPEVAQLNPARCYSCGHTYAMHSSAGHQSNCRMIGCTCIQFAYENEGHEATVHNLKTLPEWFELQRNGSKGFEIRRNDRGFCQGDVLVLEEWSPKGYTGRSLRLRVTVLVTGDGLEPGFCVMGTSKFL